MQNPVRNEPENPQIGTVKLTCTLSVLEWRVCGSIVGGLESSRS
jgi:hypothetical protein